MEQIELPLLHFPYQPYLAHFKRTHKPLAPSNFVVPWKQLRLTLYVRNLVRKGAAFIWTRADGRQFFCKTMRQLVARIMDYDGHILHSIFKGNGRLIKTV
ncbi:MULTISPECIES: hypothetical protein [unclassified Herbaspirillum]|uniref:hypothetical protein n=1 Tax=unclassified Herbaspirillum TaxID=2624150 RepID=UPI001153E511|nr:MULTISPECIES: hypothetical protein [unclassified Herbaspirillum]MBB5391278.1 hypothetical protein [Herbaspirillum sp. SJZ102]TQK13035.1 hypothetical protein FB599_0443 [Herbaspirillum sp. SJZ130]TQK15039.1 hypothetical protein FB598_0381 [Herbaspirillum sp. SJZ106]TWC67396.1 hypothetical protein FB597_104207 [Herbaspirillum sp. SJZ099]